MPGASSPLGCDFVTSLNIFGNTFKMEKRLRFLTIDITLKGMFGLGRADQNMGGALLEFSTRTAMHGTSCVSSAIYVWNN